MFIKLRSYYRILKKKFFSSKHYYLKIVSSNSPNKVVDWRRRESKEQEFDSLNKLKKEYKPDDIKHNLKVIKKTRKDVLNFFRYFSDKEVYGVKDYWASYKEIEENNFRDDCDGFAVVMYRMLQSKGFPNNKIGLVITHNHMFCMYEIDHKDFYVIDNGFLTDKIVKSSNLFPLTIKKCYYNPICGFNLYSYWRYI
jgi:predicted transglutaminase-like cysteine proteinase